MRTRRLWTRAVSRAPHATRLALLDCQARWSVLGQTPRLAGLALAARNARGSRGANTLVDLPDERLCEFLSAEITLLASKAPTPLSLRQIVDVARGGSGVVGTTSRPACAALAAPELWQRGAKVLLRELPIRFAHRIKQIEFLPEWRSSRDLAELRDLYFQSFRELRLLEPTCVDLFALNGVVVSIKRRLEVVVPLLMEAMRELREAGALDDAAADWWLDSFLLARIGTEMLTSQYVACATEGGNSWGQGGRAGVVHDRCLPAEVCERAAARTRRICLEHYRCRKSVHIRVEDAGDGEGGPSSFTYAPKYLFYMVLELLKNSVRATIEAADGSAAGLPERPITVTVSSDAGRVAVRVRDLAGGIPREAQERIWSYSYSSAPRQAEAWEHRGTPLAGYGVGLPLSRLYAQYLGGSLQLVSLPGEGTFSYLHLRRPKNEAREHLQPWQNSLEVPPSGCCPDHSCEP